jgi:hypothetical protein
LCCVSHWSQTICSVQTCTEGNLSLEMPRPPFFSQECQIWRIKKMPLSVKQRTQNFADFHLQHSHYLSLPPPIPPGLPKEECEGWIGRVRSLVQPYDEVWHAQAHLRMCDPRFAGERPASPPAPLLKSALSEYLTRTTVQAQGSGVAADALGVTAVGKNEEQLDVIMEDLELEDPMEIRGFSPPPRGCSPDLSHPFFFHARQTLLYARCTLSPPTGLAQADNSSLRVFGKCKIGT